MVAPSDTGIRDWNLLPDSILWRYIVESDSTATVGIKAPGSLKGFDKGRVLVSPESWTGAKAAIAAISGVRVVKSDTLIPWSRVRLSSPQTLATLRALPFVQYVEPAYIVPRQTPFWASGCDYNAWTGDVDRTPSGDIISRTYEWMRIDRAWAYSAGENIWIGLTDTGADEAQSDLGSGFSSGQSTNRYIWRTNTDGTSGQTSSACSHGTRMAGVLAAPMNGYGVAGVAWKSNLASVRQAGWMGDVNEIDAQQAIRDAAVRGSTVILMAWQSFDFSNAIHDEVQLWHYPPNDVLFVGAAGTSECWMEQSNVFFPAEMGEVLAVSAAESDGSRPCSAHYGPEVDVIAYHGQPTTGSASWGDTPVIVEETSNASAVVAGVAALVRARYPYKNAPGVMNQIRTTAHIACGMPDSWHRLVNAEAAVGGLCLVGGLIDGPGGVQFTDDQPDEIYADYSVNVTGGVGPIEYRWAEDKRLVPVIRTGSSIPAMTTWHTCM